MENLDFDDDGYMICGGCQGEKKIEVGPGYWIWCNICKGKGKIDWIQYVQRPPLYECPKCKGNGRLTTTHIHDFLIDDKTGEKVVMEEAKICPTCKGKGNTDWAGCARG